MTKICFFHGAENRLLAVAAWLAEAYARHERVLVYAPQAHLADSLDRLLWTRNATSFLPHCRADAPLAAQTPLLIADQLDDLAQEECLLNLADHVPPNFSRFAQVIEIVSNDEDDKLPARERFKFYRDRGYPLENQRFATDDEGQL